MGNITVLLNTLHKFTPQGQAKIMSFLRKTPACNDVNKLSLSLRGDVLLKETNSRDIIAEGLVNYINTNAKSVDANMFMQLAKELEQATLNVQAGTSIATFSKIFNNSTKRAELYRFARKDLKDKKLAQTVKDFIPTGNLEKDAEPLLSIFSGFMQNLGRLKYSHVLFDPKLNKDLRYVQKAYAEMQTLSDKILKLYKMIIPKTTDPKLREMEKMLKRKYKLDFVHLENPQQAENVAKALEIAKQKNLPIPANIIVSPYFFERGINGVNRTGSNLKTTVYIQAKPTIETEFEILSDAVPKSKERDLSFADSFVQNLWQFSTEHPEHMVMHEFLHSTNPILLCNKKILQKYKEIADKLGFYASQSFNKANEEVRNELLTKEVLEGLSKEEQKLLNLLS